MSTTPRTPARSASVLKVAEPETKSAAPTPAAVIILDDPREPAIPGEPEPRDEPTDAVTVIVPAQAEPVEAETVEAETEVAEPVEALVAEPEDASTAKKSARDIRALRLPGVLAVLAAVLLGLGTWFTVQAAGLYGPWSRNAALVDVAKTNEVTEQVTRAVQSVFSYNYKDVDRTNNAAKELLTGNAVKQYQDVFGIVREQAPAQKLVLTTTVMSVGVQRLEGDRAVLLVFGNQHSTRTDTNQTSVGAAQLEITAQRSSDKWTLTDIKVL